MIINKREIDSYDIKTDRTGRIKKIILRHGINTEEYPVEYDKNGNLMRIGAEWVNYKPTNTHTHYDFYLIEMLKEPTVFEEGLGLYRCGHVVNSTNIEPVVTNDNIYPWSFDEVTSIWSTNTVNIDNSNTNLTFSYTSMESTTISFDYSVSSESKYYDYIYYTIYKDGNEYNGGISTRIGGTSYGTLSSELLWQNVTLEVPAGEYQIIFTYYKDGSSKSGDDKGYVIMGEIETKETCEYTCTMSIPKQELEVKEFTGTNFNNVIKRFTPQYSTNIQFVDTFEEFPKEQVVGLYNIKEDKFLYVSGANNIAYLYSEDEIVTLPENCSYMFAGIENYNNGLDLSKFDSGKVIDMSYMFSECDMKFINLGDKFDTSSVTNMSHMFYECGKYYMTSLDLGDKFDTSNVTNMETMFSSCGYCYMTSLNLGDKFDTSSVTNMSYMFYKCGYNAMTTLDLGNNFNASNVTNMRYMFDECGYKALISLNLGNNFNASSATDMGYMFYKCGYNSMTSLDLGDNFNASNVTNMERMFDECGNNALISLNLGNNFNTSNVTNMYCMFYGCGYDSSTFNSLDLGDKFDTSNATNMESMFHLCGRKSLTSLDLGEKFICSSSTNIDLIFCFTGVDSILIYTNEAIYNMGVEYSSNTRSQDNFVLKY